MDLTPYAGIVLGVMVVVYVIVQLLEFSMNKRIRAVTIKRLHECELGGFDASLRQKTQIHCAHSAKEHDRCGKTPLVQDST